MEVKTDPSVSPDTPTHQLCHLGTLLSLTAIQLPVCERITAALSQVAAGSEGCPCAYLAQHLVQLRAP